MTTVFRDRKEEKKRKKKQGTTMYTGHLEQKAQLTSGVVFLHDNAHPHTAVCTKPLQEHFNWMLFDHLPYSRNLAPIDYHMYN
jgi:hypothetical protein